MASLDQLGPELSPDDWIALHAIGTGMVPAPPRATFASEMGPNERAAYTMRRRYGKEVPGPQELATPEEMRDAALTLVSTNPIARGIAAAPKIATGLLG